MFGTGKASEHFLHYLLTALHLRSIRPAFILA
jgi:hypothetical protein